MSVSEELVHISVKKRIKFDRSRWSIMHQFMPVDGPLDVSRSDTPTTQNARWIVQVWMRSGSTTGSTPGLYLLYCREMRIGGYPSFGALFTSRDGMKRALESIEAAWTAAGFNISSTWRNTHGWGGPLRETEFLWDSKPKA